ncbi:hypothetical protein AAU61_18075 [Desulfocarbo indianensis]|nr:hypothetical protein AAU61_18075 [Desulfocarbo indianensis]
MVPAWAVKAADDPLPSWRGPVKARILDYVREVTTPGRQDFIPVQERIASFDLDGTLMAERPLPFVMEVSTVWLGRNCPAFAAKGPKQALLCRAAAQGDVKTLRDNIEDVLSLPFLGMELDDYRALALEVFETFRHPQKKLLLKEMIYQPQLELMELLRKKGFAVWLCSGSSISAMQAISAKYFNIPPERCIGTRYGAEAREEGGRLVFKRGALMPGLLNLSQVKAENLKLATMTGPVLAFGNSSGDAWMLKYAAGSQRRGLALVLNHDDPREFVYAKPQLLELARQRGWSVVSMKQAWSRVFSGNGSAQLPASAGTQAGSAR